MNGPDTVQSTIPFVRRLLRSKSAPALVVCLLLGLVTVICYWPSTAHDFTTLDDGKYIELNTHVRAGLTWAGVGWAFTSGYASNWHPLTWMSHMVDCQIFRLNAGGHHFTNLLLHSLNSVLLLLLLRRMTGAFWRSALVAALFAWHPLHVESVAWVAERKDVLSTLFFLLSLWAYARYAIQDPGGRAVAGASANDKAISDESCKRKVNYIWALVFFALGLLSKPMVVTLPCVLLLLDFWPFNRLQFASFSLASLKAEWPVFRRLLWEKTPFFALSLAASVVTFLAQKAGGAVSSLVTTPVPDRIANAFVAYVRYLSKTIWPTNLSVFYPLPDHWPLMIVVGSVLVLVALSALFLRARRYPYLIVGWCWFLGTLVPTIGLVQVGSQSMADRYMYIPSIGLFVIVAWGLFDLHSACSRLKLLLPTAAAVSLVACLACTALQINYWKNSETLFRHALQAVPGNYLAYDHLANAAEKAGRNEEAIGFYSALLLQKPNYPEGNYNFGSLLMRRGDFAEAEARLRTTLKYRPQFAPAHCNLGITLFRQKKLTEAADHLQTAVQLEPSNSDAHLNLGITLLSMNRAGDAVNHFSEALRLKPNLPEIEFLLALAYQRGGKLEEAARQAQRAIEIATTAGDQQLAAKAGELLRACRATLAN